MYVKINLTVLLNLYIFKSIKSIKSIKVFILILQYKYQECLRVNSRQRLFSSSLVISPALNFCFRTRLERALASRARIKGLL